MHTTSLPNRPDLADLRFVSWLELALSGVSLRWQEQVARVVVRLMDLQGSQAWWGVTLDDRWLRGNTGAVTIFDSLHAADRFLRLLKVRRFNIGEHCEHGPFIAGHGQEVYTLGDRCSHCQRGDCEATSDQAIFHCPQLSLRRLAMNSDLPARPPQCHAARAPRPLPLATAT